MSELLKSGQVGDNFQRGGLFSGIFKALKDRKIMKVKDWLRWKKRKEDYVMTEQDVADIKYLQDNLFASLKIPKAFLDKNI